MLRRIVFASKKPVNRDSSTAKQCTRAVMQDFFYLYILLYIMYRYTYMNVDVYIYQYIPKLLQQ